MVCINNLKNIHNWTAKTILTSATPVQSAHLCFCKCIQFIHIKLFGLYDKYVYLRSYKNLVLSGFWEFIRETIQIRKTLKKYTRLNVVYLLQPLLYQHLNQKNNIDSLCGVHKETIDNDPKLCPQLRIVQDQCPRAQCPHQQL